MDDTQKRITTWTKGCSAEAVHMKLPQKTWDCSALKSRWIEREIRGGGQGFCSEVQNTETKTASAAAPDELQELNSI